MCAALFHVALRNLGPDGARREDLAGLRHRFHNRDVEAEFLAGLLHDGRVAVPPLSEMEIVPDDDVPHAQSRHQDALDEVMGAEGRQLLVEREDHGKIELVALQQGQLLGQRR